MGAPRRRGVAGMAIKGGGGGEIDLIVLEIKRDEKGTECPLFLARLLRMMHITACYRNTVQILIHNFLLHIFHIYISRIPNCAWL